MLIDSVPGAAEGFDPSIESDLLRMDDLSCYDADTQKEIGRIVIALFKILSNPPPAKKLSHPSSPVVTPLFQEEITENITQVAHETLGMHTPPQIESSSQAPEMAQEVNANQLNSDEQKIYTYLEQKNVLEDNLKQAQRIHENILKIQKLQNASHPLGSTQTSKVAQDYSNRITTYTNEIKKIDLEISKLLSL
jgi:hypothetical protein